MDKKLGKDDDEVLSDTEENKKSDKPLKRPRGRPLGSTNKKKRQNNPDAAAFKEPRIPVSNI